MFTRKIWVLFTNFEGSSIIPMFLQLLWELIIDQMKPFMVKKLPLQFYVV